MRHAQIAAAYEAQARPWTRACAALCCVLPWHHLPCSVTCVCVCMCVCVCVCVCVHACTDQKKEDAEASSGIVVPLLPFGIRQYDEGERFDLRSPYADDGWVDPEETDMFAGERLDRATVLAPVVYACMQTLYVPQSTLLCSLSTCSVCMQTLAVPQPANRAHQDPYVHACGRCCAY